MNRAVRFHRVGGPEVLVVDEVERREPGPGEARVRVEAVGVNFIDTYLRSGYYDPGPLPATAGREAVGIVEALGPGVDLVTPGERVGFCDAPGTYADEVIHRAERMVPIPQGVGAAEAVALLLQGMTAHYLARTIRPLGAGDTVLVHAAAGGVGQLVTQLAKTAGARVLGTCSTEEKAAAARAAGCDHVILYTREDFVAETLRLTDGVGVDLVIDGVGRTTFEGSVKATRVRGHVILFGQSSGEPDPIRPRRLLGSRTLTSATLFDYVRRREELLERAAEVFAEHLAGRLKVAIDRRLPLAEAAEAHRRLESRQTMGKTVLVP